MSDTEKSLKLYRDTLGLRIAGGSESSGPEQERLSSVPGARLRITTLRAAEGPALELLEYLAPRDGRPYPRDTMGEDLVRWHTLLVITDADAAAIKLAAASEMYGPTDRPSYRSSTRLPVSVGRSRCTISTVTPCSCAHDEVARGRGFVLDSCLAPRSPH